jgi:hypothetical protein
LDEIKPLNSSVKATAESRGGDQKRNKMRGLDKLEQDFGSLYVNDEHLIMGAER